MTVDSNLVDRIVAKVLAALQADGPASPASAPSVAAAAEAPAPSGSQRENGVVRLTESVVTASVLEERASGAKRVVVARTAVLTPSAWDFVRARGISLCRDDGGLAGSSSNRARWLVVQVGSLPEAQRAARDALTDFADGAELTSVDCVNRAAEQAAQAVAAARRVVVLAREAERVACLANRNSSVRAAVVWQAARIPTVRQSLDPNVWVVDPSGRTYFELKNLLKKLVAGGF